MMPQPSTVGKYSQFYWWRQNSLPFTGSIVNSSVLWHGPSHDTDSQIVSNSLDTPVNAFSVQQNVCARKHWYQNAVMVLNGRGLLHPENFDLTKPDLAGRFPPKDGQDDGGTWMPNDPKTQQPIDLTSGRYGLNLATWDTGNDVRQQVTAVELDTAREAFQSPWRVAGSQAQGQTPPGPSWYDPLLVATTVIGGFGSGSSARFTQGRFEIREGAGTDDLLYGGAQYIYDQKGILVDVKVDNVPNLNEQTSESSNILYTLEDPQQAKYQVVRMGAPGF